MVEVDKCDSGIELGENMNSRCRIGEPKTRMQADVVFEVKMRAFI